MPTFAVGTLENVPECHSFFRERKSATVQTVWGAKIFWVPINFRTNIAGRNAKGRLRIKKSSAKNIPNIFELKNFSNSLNRALESFFQIFGQFFQRKKREIAIFVRKAAIARK